MPSLQLTLGSGARGSLHKRALSVEEVGKVGARKGVYINRGKRCSHLATEPINGLVLRWARTTIK